MHSLGGRKRDRQGYAGPERRGPDPAPPRAGLARTD